MLCCYVVHITNNSYNTKFISVGFFLFVAVFSCRYSWQMKQQTRYAINTIRTFAKFSSPPSVNYETRKYTIFLLFSSFAAFMTHSRTCIPNLANIKVYRPHINAIHSMVNKSWMLIFTTFWRCQNRWNMAIYYFASES